MPMRRRQAGIAYAIVHSMELVGRLASVIGISLVLTLLLLVLYQDDKQLEATTPVVTQAAAASDHGTP